MPDLKTVLVTGSARRIGRSIACAFAQRGYGVIVHYNTSGAEAQALVEELSRNCPGTVHHAVACDLSAPGSAQRLMDSVFACLGNGPDVLVNNASCYHRGAMADAAPEAFERDFGINFLAPFELMREYHRRCSAGVVINLLDYRVELADPWSGSYGLAKKALKDATEAAAVEWAPDFRVNGIAPGIVLPPDGVPMERMQRLVDRIPMRRRTTEAEIASAALFLAETPSVNGQILYMDGGLHLLGADYLGEKRQH